MELHHLVLGGTIEGTQKVRTKFGQQAIEALTNFLGSINRDRI